MLSLLAQIDEKRHSPHVDVLASTLPVFSRIPVTEEGWVPSPLACRPCSFPERHKPLTKPQIVLTSIKPPRTASVRVDETVSGLGVTTMRWTVRSVTDQVEWWLVPLGAPLAAQVPATSTC